MTDQGSSIPPELHAAMRRALNDKSSPTEFELLEAAEHLLGTVIESNCESRSMALDLLTVDALVTQALQEAAKDPSAVAGFADEAMRRIASHPTT